MRLQSLIAVVIVAVAATYVLTTRGVPAGFDSLSAESQIDPIGAVRDAAPSPQDVLLVHVSGAVAAPGVVHLRMPARVADAVAAAGGATRKADLSLLNLASEVRDGQQIVVPERGSSAGGVPVETADPGDGRVDLNSAGVVQLTTLPGIGPVLAERIVRHREQEGPFRVVEDLLDVAGIGEARLLELRDLVEV